MEPRLFHPQEKYIHNTDAFIPFSVGPTNCAGKSLAWLEMRLAVSAIISRFDLKLDPAYDPCKWYDDIGDYFAIIKGEVPTLVSPRESDKGLVFFVFFFHGYCVNTYISTIFDSLKGIESKLRITVTVSLEELNIII